jgi:acyl-CoA thioesterase-1
MSKYVASGTAAVSAVVFSLFAACDSRSTPTSPGAVSDGTQVTTQRVVVLGDSLAVTPTRDESFPAVLQERIRDRSLNWAVTNAGISGDTTAGGRRRVEALLGRDVGVLVLALGANDGLRRVSPDTIEDNLEAIIEKARERNVAVLLCGMEMPSRDVPYSLGFHNLYRRLASKFQTPFVPFLLSGVLLNPDYNGSDLIHPNRAGAQRIAQNVWPHLEPMLDP